MVLVKAEAESSQSTEPWLMTKNGAKYNSWLTRSCVFVTADCIHRNITGAITATATMAFHTSVYLAKAA